MSAARWGRWGAFSTAKTRMRKELLVALVIGLVIGVVGLTAVLWVNKGSHLELQGTIQKVRTIALDEATAIVADFRFTNASDALLMVREVAMILTDAEGKEIQGALAADSDAKRMMDYYTAIGPKYNDSLKMRDRVKGRETVDRMLAARFEIPEAKVQARRNLRVRITDMDGAVSEISEKP